MPTIYCFVRIKGSILHALKTFLILSRVLSSPESDKKVGQLLTVNIGVIRETTEIQLEQYSQSGPTSIRKAIGPVSFSACSNDRSISWTMGSSAPDIR